MIFVLSGNTHKVRSQMSALRMEMAERLGLRDPKVFAPLWVVDFPLLEWDEESNRYHAMHHPFTAPKPEQMDLLHSNPSEVNANAYDLVLNGNEIGGGSIRIHDKATQSQMFDLLGFTPEAAKSQFGFLMNAFEFAADEGVKEALSVMANGILDADGTIADFQGDAALGFWGWPVALEEGPVPACRAALEIQRQLP